MTQQQSKRRSVKPTSEQFSAYRTKKRESMRSIVKCIRAGTQLMTPWAIETICRLRKEHTESVARQRTGRAS
jgi:hypothetical protein